MLACLPARVLLPYILFHNAISQLQLSLSHINQETLLTHLNTRTPMSPLIMDDQPTTRSTSTSPPPKTFSAKGRHFAIVPAKLPDARRLVDIEFHAFESNQVNQILSYRDYKKASHFERSVRLYEDAMSSPLQPTQSKHEGRPRADSRFDHCEQPGMQPGVEFSKVVDTQTQEIVSFAKVEMKTYTLAELRSPPDAGHEGEARMNQDWFALNERLRREYVGLREHCCVSLFHSFFLICVYSCFPSYSPRALTDASPSLTDIGMLATAPLHQHHGAGTLLLRRILAAADAAGVEVYLEATDSAKRLYERHGFEEVTELRFDPAAYGVKGLGVERQTVMVRAALGSAEGVRSWDDAAAETRALLASA